MHLVTVEPKVKLLLGRPLLNKLKPKELKQMARQYQGLFDEYDVSYISHSGCYYKFQTLLRMVFKFWFTYLN